LRQLACHPRRFDPLPILIELQCRLADFANRLELRAPQPCDRLLAFELRAGERRLLAAAAERIAEREADRPCRIVRHERLAQHVTERGEILADDRARESARTEQFG